MKRKRIKPRTDIPDWRDKNMPVLMLAEVEGKVMLYPCKPEHVTQYYAHKMAFNTVSVGWRDDPTYDLKVKKWNKKY